MNYLSTMGIDSKIKAHPVLKKKESQSIFCRLRRPSFDKIVNSWSNFYNKVIVMYNKRNDNFKICQS